VNLKRNLERKKLAKLREIESKSPKNKSALTLYLENSKNSENPFIRFFAHFFYTTWVIVLTVGGFLALVFGYIAA